MICQVLYYGYGTCWAMAGAIHICYGVTQTIVSPQSSTYGDDDGDNGDDDDGDVNGDSDAEGWPGSNEDDDD